MLSPSPKGVSEEAQFLSQQIASLLPQGHADLFASGSGSGVSLQCEGFKLEAESIRDGYQTLTDQLRGVSVDAKVFPVPFSA